LFRLPFLVLSKAEYGEYSHPDSAPNTRLLSGGDQATYSKEQFAPKTELQFHLLNNEQIDRKNFDVTKRYAEIFGRVVMQLNATKDRPLGEHLVSKILSKIQGTDMWSDLE
jgi:hypothetical protein